MKAVDFFTFLSSCLICLNSFAQSPKAIEADLYKSFKKIDYWNNRQNDGGTDSLENANDNFEKKLRKYTAEYPFTIDEKFTSLQKEHLDIASSSDGMFRIYSWDTGEGGTVRDFQNVFQYKFNNKTVSNYRPADSLEEDRSAYRFSNIYALKTNGKTYYLAVYNGVYSTKDAGQGMQIFTIENGKLNDNVKLIKTKTGLRNKLYYDYDFFSVADWKVRPSIYFDDASQTIFVPLVDGNRKVTRKYNSYKFNGQYFEMVKN